MAEKRRKSFREKRYDRCVELMSSSNSVYDIDIKLFIANYEELEHLKSKD